MFAVKFWDLSLKIQAQSQKKTNDHKVAQVTRIVFYAFILVLTVLIAVFVHGFYKELNNPELFTETDTFFLHWC